MSRPKRVLLIAPYFPPRRRVGSQRPFRFAVNLPHFGWDVSVVTINTPGSELTEFERRALGQTRILGLPVPMDRTLHSESSLKPASDSPRENHGSTLVDRVFPVDTWLPVFLWHSKKVIRWAEEIKPDIVWSTADPWSGHVLAGLVASRLHKPWVADFRDPWTICPVRSAKRLAPTRWLDRMIERVIFRHASHVVFTAGQTRQAYVAKMPFRFNSSTIYNSFDRCHDVQRRVDHAGPWLDLVFFGRFRELSPARPTIELLSTLRRLHPDAFSFIRVHSFGPLTREDREYANRLGVEKSFCFADPVTPEQATATLQKFDVLLLSSDPRRSEIIPAKLWDYLAARRPILSLAANPEVGKILSETHSGVQFSPPGWLNAADLLARAWRAKKEGTRLPMNFDDGADRVESYNARATTASLAEIFDALR